jgi:hypothetical protein
MGEIANDDVITTVVVVVGGTIGGLIWPTFFTI